MSERIDVCNLALTWLGHDPITGLDDESDAAELCVLNYDLARDATLEAHDWSFALKRFVPAKDATAPAFGPANRFRIPSDIMRVVSVDYDPDQYSTSRREAADWTVESGFILTSDDAIYCRGIRRIDDEGIYSALFCHAFAAKLAALIAMPLTQSRSLFEQMTQMYTGMVMEATNRDSQQGRTRRLRNRGWLKAR